MKRLLFGFLALAIAVFGGGCSCSQTGSLRFDNLPSSIPSGAGQVFTLTAVGGDGKTTLDGYTGTVYFVTDDPGATVPAPYTYVAADHGAHSFSITLVNAGQHVIRASDANNSSFKGSATVTCVASDGALLAIVKGNGQVAAVGNKLPGPLVVNVTDAYGNPVSGQSVSWASSVPGAKVSAATSTTGDDGNAQVTATLGQSPGFQTFTATAKGLVGSPATFTETASAAPPANIVLVSGDGQTAAVLAALPAPMVVKVTDAFGNPSAQIDVNWSVASGGGAVAQATTKTGFDGLASTNATLGATPGPNTFQATAINPANQQPVQGSPIVFTENSVSDVGTIGYTNPTATGKIQLVQNAASTNQVIVLDLVATVALTGWAVGFDLPLDSTKVQLDATAPIVAGTVLLPGSAPAAMSAAIPATGPYSAILSTGLSQKASGAGAVTTDTPVPAGTVLYTIKLNRVAGAPAGVVFDGANLGPGFRAGFLDKMGNNVATASDFVIGKLQTN